LSDLRTILPCVDKELLEKELKEGRSFESIAREAGRHPSTVAYWAKRFGLVSPHAARHAAKGGIEKARLEALVSGGHSIRSMAEEIGVGYQTVRYWLGRYGLATPRAERLRVTRASAPEGQTATLVCPTHGPVRHRRRKDGSYRCLVCRSEAVTRRRRRVKAMLVAEHGGRCVICGFEGVPGAFHFHHLDRETKSFALSSGGLARALTKARAEAAKCVLLCANCHASVEIGRERIPFRDSRRVVGEIGPG
jgi:hypothetical protein